MELKFKVDKSAILLEIPAVNKKGYRFNKRKNHRDFGKTFSTRKAPFDKTTYLEWQIGYDVPAKEVDKGIKKTIFEQTFISNKRVKKYPYELPEIFKLVMQSGLISNKQVSNLIKEIESYKVFLDEKDISVKQHAQQTINGIEFEETSIQLPKFFIVNKSDNTQTEAAIQKQQHATGVQPMVYFCIPLTSFRNYASILGRSSVGNEFLEYAIDRNNVEVLHNLMRVFGMASKRHNHDIIQILKTLI